MTDAFSGVQFRRGVSLSLSLSPCGHSSVMSQQRLEIGRVTQPPKKTTSLKSKGASGQFLPSSLVIGSHLGLALSSVSSVLFCPFRPFYCLNKQHRQFATAAADTDRVHSMLGRLWSRGIEKRVVFSHAIGGGFFGGRRRCRRSQTRSLVP